MGAGLVTGTGQDLAQRVHVHAHSFAKVDAAQQPT
jgi:hypothetical protein